MNATCFGAREVGTVGTTGVPHKDRSLVNAVTRPAVCGTSIRRVVVIKATTGAIKLNQLIAHDGCNVELRITVLSPPERGSWFLRHVVSSDLQPRWRPGSCCLILHTAPPHVLDQTWTNDIGLPYSSFRTLTRFSMPRPSLCLTVNIKNAYGFEHVLSAFAAHLDYTSVSEGRSNLLKFLSKRGLDFSLVGIWVCNMDDSLKDCRKSRN